MKIDINRRGAYYLAYGYNLNHEGMAWRCPKAKFITGLIIPGFRLMFRGHDRAATANMEDWSKTQFKPKAGGCPVGLWKLTKKDWAALDAFEGYPGNYDLREITVKLPGSWKKVTALYYAHTCGRKCNRPPESYLAAITQGYFDCGLTRGLPHLRESVTMANLMNTLNSFDEPDIPLYKHYRLRGGDSFAASGEGGVYDDE